MLSVDDMSGLDLIGVVLLGLAGASLLWLGNRTEAGDIDLNLGIFNAENTPREAWKRMNQRAGRDLSRIGKTMAGAAVGFAVLALLLPAGLAGMLSVAALVGGPVLAAWLAARHAVDPHQDWHP